MEDDEGEDSYEEVLVTGQPCSQERFYLNKAGCDPLGHLVDGGFRFTHIVSAEEFNRTHHGNVNNVVGYFAADQPVNHVLYQRKYADLKLPWFPRRSGRIWPAPRDEVISFSYIDWMLRDLVTKIRTLRPVFMPPPSPFNNNIQPGGHWVVRWPDIRLADDEVERGLREQQEARDSWRYRSAAMDGEKKRREASMKQHRAHYPHNGKKQQHHYYHRTNHQQRQFHQKEAHWRTCKAKKRK